MSFRVSDLVAQGIIQGSSAYANIFYDSANTAYYVDPASTSVLNGLTVGGSSVVTNNGGTWGINITGNAGSATTSLRGTIEDTRSGQRTPNDYDDYRVSWEFTNQIPGLSGSSWWSLMTMQGWHNAYAAWQIIGPSDAAPENWYLRSGNNTTWNTARSILHSGNYNSYSPTLTGGGASGTWGINITGSAGSASTASQVTINYNNDSNSTYQLLWGSGNSVYGTGDVWVNPSSDVINARGGFISNSNPWGTSNSAFFPNGITTAGGTNWVYGFTYIGNAPSNGSGAEVGSDGRFYFRNGNTSGNWGYAGLYVDRNNAANNYVPYSFEAEYGNHSWGIVTRFHIQQAAADRPSIQFTSAGGNDRWSLGYCTSSDWNFRITQNQGYRTDNSGYDGWGTERFRINTDGTTYLGIQGQIVYFNGAESANLYGIRGRFSNEYIHLYNKVGIGHPSGWGQGEGNTPNQGLSTYGGASFAYGTGAASTFYGLVRLASNNNLYLDNNYGQSIVGLYSASRYQGIFAMGDAYKLAIDGTTTGSLYGLAWSHPNAGGVAGNLNTHGLLVMENGTFLAAVSGSIRARDDMRAPIFYDSNDTGYYLDPNGTSVLSTVRTIGQIYINNGDPTIFLQDTNHRSAMIHVNSNEFYVLRGSGNNSTGWSTYNGYWPLVINLENNNATFGGTVSAPAGDMRAPIFYDSNNTGYYLDPDDTSNLWRFTQGTLDRHSLNSRQVNSPWSTRYAQGTLYQTGAMGWGQYDFNVIGSNWGSGFFDTWSNPGNAPGGSSHYVGMQAFHYNNSDSSKFHGWQMACAQEANNRWFWRSAWDTPRSWVEMIHSGNIGSQSVNYASSAGNADTVDGYHASGLWKLNEWNGNIYGHTDGRIYGTIFYDSNDSSYYCDPNSTSRFNAVGSFLLHNNYGISTDYQFGISFNNVFDSAYAIFRESGAWSFPFPDLRIAFHTGIKLGANASYNGIRFYDDYNMATQVMSVNNSSDGLGANNVYVNNSLVAGSSLRAPIFYDSNDTTYYADFNNTGRSMYTAGYLQSDRMIMKGSSGGGQIYPTISYGGVSLYGGDQFTNGAYFTVTGIDYGSSPGAGSAEFVIRSTATSKFALFSYNGSTWTGRYGLFGSTGNVTIGDANTDIGYRLYVIGDIYATGNIIAYSDARVKTNVREIENPLARVLNTRGVMYDRTDNEEKDSVGFIAQELEKEFPELVSTSTDGRKGVKYQNMVAVLIEAMKEQNKEIQKLKLLINGTSN